MTTENRRRRAAQVRLALLATTLFSTAIHSAACAETCGEGGVTFDFAAISERRFSHAFDPARNVLKEPLSGTATNSFRKVFALPNTNGGIWRVSAHYRMRHATPGAARFSLTPGGARPFEILECGAGWGTLSSTAEVPPGTASLEAFFNLGRNTAVEFEYRDLSLVDETPTTPIVLKEMPMGNLDRSFAVAAGQCGVMEYYWRRYGAQTFTSGQMSFEVRLPPGIEYADASFADKETVRTQTGPDGSSVTTFGCRRGEKPYGKYNTWTGLRLVVRATGKPGPCGRGRLTLKCSKDGTSIDIHTPEMDFLIVEPFNARKPQRYCNGVMTGGIMEDLSAETIKSISEMMASAGVTWMVDRASQDTYRLWRSLGIRRITPTAWQFNNGFQIGPGKIPESDRYVAAGVDSKDRHASAIASAVCPVTVYEGSEFFRTKTVPFIQKFINGTDGCWSNWEPYMFSRKGCMCQRCCRAFASYLGKPYEEIAAKWPKCIMAGGEYFKTVLKFRSIEHGKVVRTLDRVVREATGGDASLGFIPAIAWIEMSSWWRPRNYAAEVQAIDYAGSLRWMNPWGPYVAWESNNPYIYTKRKPICHFFAAQDVRRTVDSDYPPAARPKLMALPQGYQCGHWLSQPEHIAMALDSYFFNGWESTVEYYFPRGYDARYWNAFAKATDRAAKYEAFVLDGRRTDGETSVEPLPGVYASPARMLSGYLPGYRNISPLQNVSYDKDGARIVAVLNFWQQGEAFFKLRANGLKPGRYVVCDEDGTVRAQSESQPSYSAEELANGGVKVSVGAARTRVFEIRPYAPGAAAKSMETDAAFKARFDSLRPALERKAAEDAEYERLNGEVIQDSMPVI